MPAETYTGKPCRRCGSTLRYVHQRRCADCVRRRNRELTDAGYYAKHQQRRREDHIAYYGDLLKNRRRAALRRMEARHNG